MIGVRKDLTGGLSMIYMLFLLVVMELSSYKIPGRKGTKEELRS
jgi:hypothetical protein